MAVSKTEAFGKLISVDKSYILLALACVSWYNTIMYVIPSMERSAFV